MTPEALLLKKLEREKAARKQAEDLIEKKSLELHKSKVLLEQANKSLSLQVVEESENFLKEARKLDALFDHSLDGIVLINMKGYATRVNQRICEILEVLDFELEDHFVLDVFGKFGVSRNRAYRMYLTLKSKKVLQRELDIVLPNKKKSVEISAQLLEVKGDTFIQTIIRDITVRKENLRALQKAKLEALQSSATKSKFLATMSHEIRTPLNGIIGFTDLLLEDSFNSTQDDYLQTIKHSSSILLNILNDILDLSKIENNSLELENIEFNFIKCIENALQIHSGQAQTKGLELISNISPKVPLMRRGDPGKLQQILTNLLSNALKFTSTGAVTLNVYTDRKYNLIIEVHDTGVGFDQKLEEKLFTAFKQADESTTRKYGGTGLGLAICRQLVELKGGKISVTSAVGQGATFKVCLPKETVNDDIYQDKLRLKKKVKIIAFIQNAYLASFIRGYGESIGMPIEICEKDEDCISALETSPDFFITDQSSKGKWIASKKATITSAGYKHSILITERQNLAFLQQEKSFDSILTKPLFSHKLSELINDNIEHVKKASGDAAKQLKEESQKLKVLLVEDNLINVKLATYLLKRLDFSVSVASNGQKSLDMLCEPTASYSLVCMDMRMPVMDGLEATRRIRAGEAGSRWTTVPIIAMTANTSEEDRDNCFESGMDYFLTKPIEVEKLAMVVRELGFVE